MHEFRCLQFDGDERRVVTAWLDVPGRSVNVLDEALFADLDQFAATVERARDTRLVVFRSRKESGFLAGADLRRIQALASPAEAEAFSALGQRVFERIERLAPATLAVIHGPCLGGGLEFALACRHRIARDDPRTRLGLPEVKLGLVPAWGGTQRLPRLVGLSTALPMILDGRDVTAVDAERIGLVDAAASAEGFDRAVEEHVERLLSAVPRCRNPHGWRDRTRLGRWLVLRRAGQQAVDGPSAAAVRAIRGGSAVERSEFARLLFTPECRQQLEEFFSRGRASRG